jgi:uncharacterized protein (TIGR02996 family)
VGRASFEEAWGNLRMKVPPSRAADLTGAPDDAIVMANSYPNGGGVSLELKGQHVEAFREVFRGRDGALVIQNQGIEVSPEMRGQGLGLEIFASQVIAAAEAGVSRITCMAAGGGGRGRPGYQSEYNGYYTWPLFGYDADISSLQNPEVIALCQRHFPQAKTVLDIFMMGGRRWWKDNGCKIPTAVFDLRPGSRSLTVLQAYMEEKGVGSRSPTPPPSNSPPPTAPGSGYARSSGVSHPADYARHAVRAPAGGAAWKNKLYRGGKFVPSEYAQAQTADAEPMNYGPEDELAGFHQVIRENPLEATHHAVLADWHDDRGEAEEADFRRRIASWLHATPPTYREGHARPWFLPGNFEKAQWPPGVRGVTVRMEPNTIEGWGIGDGKVVEMPPDDSGGLWEAYGWGHPEYGNSGTSWRDYDEMIDSLRESFLYWLSREGVS